MVIDVSIIEQQLELALGEKGSTVKELQVLDQGMNDARARYQQEKARLIATGMHADGRIACCEDLLRLQKSGEVE